jgi:hypothetical protein
MLHGVPSSMFHSYLTSRRLLTFSSTLGTPGLADESYPVLSLFCSAKINAVPMLDVNAELIELS